MMEVLANTNNMQVYQSNMSYTLNLQNVMSIIPQKKKEKTILKL